VTENGVSEPTPTQPERMCAGCRQPAAKQALERFIFHDEAGLVFDLRCKAPGRGAYVHPKVACVQRAVDEGGFSRGFKRRVEADLNEVLEDMRRGIARRLGESLSVASASKQLFVGGSSVSEAFVEADLGLVLIASDAGESTRRKYRSNAERKSIPVCEALSGEELASGVGHEFVAVAAVARSQALDRVRRDIGHLEQLGAV
jgi:uncharacterized protein